jgi:hypothetical protein
MDDVMARCLDARGGRDHVHHHEGRNIAARGGRQNLAGAFQHLIQAPVFSSRTGICPAPAAFARLLAGIPNHDLGVI